MFTSGSPAPELVLEDTEGRTVRLSDYRGKHAVLLYFMRSTSCPVCNRHVRDLVTSADGLAAANLRVLVAVPEDGAKAARWKAKYQIPFPVVTGGREIPHEMVGLGRKVFGLMQQSGSILIDSEGIIRHAQGATLPVGGYDKKGVTSAIASLGAPA
jgi:peroxiredoxin